MVFVTRSTRVLGKGKFDEASFSRPDPPKTKVWLNSVPPQREADQKPGKPPTEIFIIFGRLTGSEHREPVLSARHFSEALLPRDGGELSTRARVDVLLEDAATGTTCEAASAG